jgi:adenylate kinase family enzyme
VQRVAVMGTTCSGKTTLARALADRLELPYIELDALYWGPDWSEPEPEEFRSRVEPFVRGDAWVLDGNYTSKLGDLVLERADTLVWLDLPLPRILWRTLSRTIHRITSGAELWSRNRETWRTAFLTRNSLFVWALRTHWRFRRKLPQRVASDFAQLRLVRLRTPAQARQWLERVAH